MLKDFTIFHGKYSSGDKRTFIKCAKLALIVMMVMVIAGCGLTNMFAKRGGKSYVINGKRYYILASAKGYNERGLASWYGEPFHGRKTASGEVYDMNKISAAHKTLPLHTWVQVKNMETNQTMVMRVNDRGPFVKGRIIDLSRAAAEEMGMLKSGVAKVQVKAITGEKARQLTAAFEANNGIMLAELVEPDRSDTMLLAEQQAQIEGQLALPEHLMENLERIDHAPSAGSDESPR